MVQWAKHSNLIVKYLIGGIAYVLLTKRELKYGIHTNTNIEIGKGLHIVHFGNIFLNVKKIGDNFTVFQNVTFGKRYKNDEVPTIGNRVTVCTGSVICGGVLLFDGCTVGACSYVNKDVPENCTVAGLPAVVIKK